MQDQNNSLRYSSPPIQEALISVRLAFPQKLTMETLDEFYNIVKDDFPQKNYNKSISFSFNPEQGPLVEQDAIEGLILRAPDGQKAIQLNNDGYIFSYIQHYTGWGVFLDDALRYLKVVLDVFSPTPTGVISTRFINKIPVNKQEPLSEIFSTHISFRNESPMPKEYLLQYATGMGDIRCNVVQTKDLSSETPNSEVVILDIEAAYNGSVDSEDLLLSELAAWKQLQSSKNTIFEETLTNKAKEKFNV